MKTLIYFDNSSYEREIAQYKANLPHMQKVVTTYNEMQLPALTSEDFTRLFTETEILIFDKMTGGEPLSIAGLKVNKTKAFEILHKPDGYEAFIKALESATNDLRSDFGYSKSIAAANVNSFYELNNEGNVVIKESFIEKTESWNKRWATSETANKVFEFSNFVIDKCKELGLTELTKHNPNGFGRFMSEIVDGGAGKELKVNVKTILEYNNK